MRLSTRSLLPATALAATSALLTGCYNVRVGIFGALGPNSKVGLNPDERFGRCKAASPLNHQLITLANPERHTVEL